MSFTSNYPSFSTYAEAIEYVGISPESECFTITHHRDSYEKIIQGGRVIRILGKGPVKTPGRPAGNQNFQQQTKLFYNVKMNANLFPVFYSDSKGSIRFMGTYTFMNYEKKISPSGFTYFELTFHRLYREYLPDKKPEQINQD